LKIPYQRLAVAASVLAFAGAGTALANGNGNDQRFGPAGSSGPSGPTGPRPAPPGPKGHHHKRHHGKHRHFRFHRPHRANYVFSGTWSSADSSVSVSGGNTKVRKAGFVGQSVKFDTTKTRVLVFDTNGDNKANTLADVKDGDTVLVLARLPKDGSATQPFKAAKLLDVTNLPSFGGGWEG
jgi:hypothetical protein